MPVSSWPQQQNAPALSAQVSDVGGSGNQLSSRYTLARGKATAQGGQLEVNMTLNSKMEEESQRQMEGEFIKMLEESKKFELCRTVSKALLLLQDDDQIQADVRFKAVEGKNHQALLRRYISNRRKEKAENRKQFKQFLGTCEYIKADTKWNIVKYFLDFDERYTRLRESVRVELYKEHITKLRKAEKAKKEGESEAKEKEEKAREREKDRDREKEREKGKEQSRKGKGDSERLEVRDGHKHKDKKSENDKDGSDHKKSRKRGHSPVSDSESRHKKHRTDR